MSNIQAVKLELIRMRLIKKLLAVDEISVLEEFEKLLPGTSTKSAEHLTDDEIIFNELGHWLNGEKITVESLKKRIESAEIQKKNGDLKSHEDFQKEAENW